MADRRPARSTAGERETVLGLLQFQRESFLRCVEGVEEDQARWSPVPSGTNLLWLTKHLSLAEEIWLRHRFTGELTRDEVVDHTVRPGDTLAAAVDRYRQTWASSDAIVAASSLDDRAQLEPGDPVHLRWILGHLLEETARHAGHADLIRELLDGETGR